MLAPFLMGLAGGQRSFTPLAAVAAASARGELLAGDGALSALGRPAAAAAIVALAAAEYAGDKLRSAPDRIVPAGLAARLLASGLAGAALAPRHRRWAGAAVCGLTAVAASFPGWRLRRAAMARYGQISTGFVEDALTLACAIAVVRATSRAT